MYIIGNIVNNIAITLYGSRWLADVSRQSTHNVCQCQITISTPETDILYVNPISILENKMKGRKKRFGPKNTN